MENPSNRIKNPQYPDKNLENLRTNSKIRFLTKKNPVKTRKENLKPRFKQYVNRIEAVQDLIHSAENVSRT